MNYIESVVTNILNNKKYFNGGEVLSNEVNDFIAEIITELGSKNRTKGEQVKIIDTIVFDHKKQSVIASSLNKFKLFETMQDFLYVTVLILGYQEHLKNTHLN